VIAEALTTCNNVFDEKQKKYKAVILITDGKITMKCIEIAGKMAEEGVVIHTIGWAVRLVLRS
jgi:Ca-activated chloride channel family protein